MKVFVLFGFLLIIAAIFNGATASRDARPVRPSISAPPPKRERPIIYDAPIRTGKPKTMYA